MKKIGSVDISTMLGINPRFSVLRCSYTSVYTALRCSKILSFRHNLAKCQQTLVACSILLFSTTIQAASFYCATQGGNGYINTGDTMAKVQATCGAPTSTSQQQTSNIMQEQIQTWVYAPRLVSTTNPDNNNSIIGSQQIINNQAPSVTFQVVNNQITAINSSQRGAVQQFTCPSGQTISVGSNVNQLGNACGQPTTVNTTSQQVSVQPHVITYWSYQVNQYSKPMVMQFQDGYLVQVQL